MELADITEIGLDEVRFGPGTISFDKLHGNGNDFMLIDEIRSELVPESMKAAFAVRCCRRNFGVGADGVLFLVKSDRSDIGMRLFQPDGSEAEMCGNGIRCLAKYAWSAGYVGESFSVETLAGIIPVEVREVDGTFWARVEMGTPRFDRPSIPALGEGEVVMEAIGDAVVSAVNTGVPHAVIIVDDLDVSLKEIATPIRHCSLFPQGTNVNLVKVGSTLEIRTFERGVEGETFSCGTGAVASAAVARRLGLIGEEVLVETRGGPLIIYFEGEEAFMEGPAVTVFSGELSEEYQRSLWQEL
ncbi:MAG: diaminopimelate epimerase [Methanotrichaceae archaeon]|nr:diaminopimelate epimerase [Methanotrichaceae archaeon]